MIKKEILIGAIFCFTINSVYSQWQQGGNNNVTGNINTQTIGTNNNRPFRIETRNIQRMYFAPGIGVGSGYIGIGTNFSNPVSPLHVVGRDAFSSAGWSRAITISNHGVLAFSNQGTGAQSTFFMGAPANDGDFYMGTSPSTLGGASNGPVKYAFKVYGENPINPVGGIEQTSMLFYNNSYFMSSQLDATYVGINTLHADRKFEVVGDDKDPQFRLSFEDDLLAPSNIRYTDFNTQGYGLNITPINTSINENRRRVFIHRGGTTITQISLNVNGNGRFRYIPQGNADCLILGRHNQGGANDNTFRRLEFTGNTNDVLLGNGTWGQVNTDACWDTNGDGIQDAAEDINNDGLWNALDCQGAQGIVGPQGIQGNNGATGSQGPIGLTGNTGPQGSTGVIGATGPAGQDGFSTGAHNGTSMSTLDATKVSFGNDYGATTGQLLSSREVPMNDHNIIFTDNSSANYPKNRIGVGTNNPLAKFHVNLNNQIVVSNSTAFIVENHAQNNLGNGSGTGIRVAVDGDNTGGSNGVWIDIVNTQSSNQGVRANLTGGATNNGIAAYCKDATGINIGVIGNALSATVSANSNYGVQGDATYATINNIGGRFSARGINGGGTTKSYGVYAQANGNSQYNYGIYGSARDATTANYGVYGTINTSGTYQNYAGYFNGDVYIAGSYGPSDINMKTNIVNYDSSLYVINQLNPKTFEYTSANYQGMNLPSGHQYGLIAQEVDLIIPSIVSDNIHPAQYDSTGTMIYPAYNYKGVDYNSLIPILVGGIQEQQALITTQDSTISVQDSLINDLNSRLITLESCLENLLPMLCQINNSMILENNTDTQDELRTFLNVDLTDGESIVLEQNVPNPFAEQTTIRYSIPASVSMAQIHFYNQDGKLINTINIDERGNGQINVFASDLSSGIYTYTLVADGQVVATKRMVKTK